MHWVDIFSLDANSLYGFSSSELPPTTCSRIFLFLHLAIVISASSNCFVKMNLPTQSRLNSFFSVEYERIKVLSVTSHPDSLSIIGVLCKYFFIALPESEEAATIYDALSAALCTRLAVLSWYLFSVFLIIINTSQVSDLEYFDEK